MSNRLNNEYATLNRAWKVSTEGDDAGMSSVTLGTFCGNLDDIAFALAEHAPSTLTFKAVDITPPAPKNLRKSVDVRLDIDSGTWEMHSEKRVSVMNEILKQNPDTETSVAPSSFSGCVRLTRRISDLDIKRYAALQKLTPEERLILGLE